MLHHSHSLYFTESSCTCVHLFCPAPYREEAELEYIRVAQDLEMFGINYFEIKVL